MKQRIGKLLLGPVAYGLGMVLSGMLIAALHWPTMPAVPGDSRSPENQFLVSLLLCPILMASLLPLAEGMRGKWIHRCLALAGLLFVTLGLNTVIELTIFSTMLPDKNLLVSAIFVLPALFVGALATFGKARTEPSTFADINAASWAWRLPVAWLAFPVIYFFFGMCIAPIVVPHYNAGIAGLTIPPIDVIIRTQLVRSLIFLAASFPAVLLWTKSRTQFIVAMGLLHAMTVGIFQLAQAGFLPMVLRVTHSVEITADSFAYAAVLGLLFIRSRRAEASQLVKTAAA
jgi:hypothetical protein